MVRADSRTSGKPKLVIIHCTDLTERQVSQGHWRVQEDPFSTGGDDGSHRSFSLTSIELNNRKIAGGRLAGTQCGDHCTALVGQYGHVSVIRAECGVPAAEQPVQHRGNWLLSIFVHPGVIMGPVRPIKPASGLFAKQPERVKLLTSDSHWYCP